MTQLNSTLAKHSRLLEGKVAGIPTSDGAGVKLLRVLTPNLQRRLDPFLMLDEFRSDQADDYIAGFPDHPHRGFETVTYMLTGRMRHRDNQGNEGLLQAGDVQWMTAGRGIIHSELPEQEEGLMHGFQLWLNLPSQSKLCTPAYQDISAQQIPLLTPQEGANIKLIAGAFEGHQGAVQRPQTEPLYLDIELSAGSQYFAAIPASHNAFLYLYQGSLAVGEHAQLLQAQHLGILNNDADSQGVWLQAKQPSRVLLIAGRPLAEPIAQWGPFVMNTREEIEQAVEDYRNGRF